MCHRDPGPPKVTTSQNRSLVVNIWRLRRHMDSGCHTKHSALCVSCFYKKTLRSGMMKAAVITCAELRFLFCFLCSAFNFTLSIFLFAIRIKTRWLVRRALWLQGPDHRDGCEQAAGPGCAPFPAHPPMGQLLLLHICCSLTSPTQSLPPCWGSGLLQTRVRSRIPPAQVTVQADHGDQGLHRPSTVDREHRQSRGR